MKSEKANAGYIGSNTNLENALTMEKNNSNQNKFQLDSAKSRRNVLESTRLSRLPERRKFEIPKFEVPTKAPVCIGCGGKLEFDNDLQQSIKGCRKCIGIYARLDTAFDEDEKRRRRETLERFIGGAK